MANVLPAPRFRFEPTRIDFAHWCMTAILGSEGWPRRTMLVGQKVVPGKIVMLASGTLSQYSYALGAGRPGVSCQLLTLLFASRNWATQSPDQLFHDLDPHSKIQADSGNPPWYVLAEPKEFENLAHIPWKFLREPAANLAFAATCAKSLIWGLAHPQDVSRALEVECAKIEKLANAGLNLPVVPSPASTTLAADLMVNEYEVAAGPLPQAAGELLLSRLVQGRLNPA